MKRGKYEKYEGAEARLFFFLQNTFRLQPADASGLISGRRAVDVVDSLLRLAWDPQPRVARSLWPHLTMPAAEAMCDDLPLKVRPLENVVGLIHYWSWCVATLAKIPPLRGRRPDFVFGDVTMAEWAVFESDPLVLVRHLGAVAATRVPDVLRAFRRETDASTPTQKRHAVATMLVWHATRPPPLELVRSECEAAGLPWKEDFLNPTEDVSCGHWRSHPLFLEEHVRTPRRETFAAARARCGSALSYEDFKDWVAYDALRPGSLEKYVDPAGVPRVARRSARDGERRMVLHVVAYALTGVASSSPPPP